MTAPGFALQDPATRHDRREAAETVTTAGNEAYYSDESIRLFHGDALDVLRTMPDQSVNCCVTSPPYFGLRDYGEPGQYGLEASPAEYVETMRALFAEVRRVLADDGTLWLNLGDSYYSGRGNPGPNSADEKQEARRGWTRALDQPGASWGTPKSLLQIPARVSLALQDDGWTLRNDIIWHKPNAMPESVTDRLSCDYEHLYLLTKSRFYYFDIDPIREPLSRPEAVAEGIVFGGSAPDVGRRRGSTYGASRRDSFARATKEADVPGQTQVQHREDRPNVVAANPLGRNPGSVWDIPTSPFPAAHFATMPSALAERCVLAGCKPGGTVLDPFSGSGTTGLAATKHGRRYVGIDLNADYLDLSLRTRLAQGALDFGTTA